VANRALDFTAGGQLFEAYWNMFIASLRPVFWAAIFCATVVGCWLLWNLYQPLDFYYAMIAGLSKFWTVMGFSPDKMLNVQTDTGRVMVRMRNVDLLPQVGQALDRWTHILSWMTVAFLGGGLLLGGLYIRFAEHLSRNTRKRTHERGAAITDAASLAEMIADDNAQKLKAEQASPPPKGERTSNGLPGYSGLLYPLYHCRGAMAVAHRTDALHGHGDNRYRQINRPPGYTDTSQSAEGKGGRIRSHRVVRRALL